MPVFSSRWQALNTVEVTSYVTQCRKLGLRLQLLPKKAARVGAEVELCCTCSVFQGREWHPTKDSEWSVFEEKSSMMQVYITDSVGCFQSYHIKGLLALRSTKIRSLLSMSMHRPCWWWEICDAAETTSISIRLEVCAARPRNDEGGTCTSMLFSAVPPCFIGLLYLMLIVSKLY